MSAPGGFDVWIGVDQTGAVRKGRGGVRTPVPLKAVVISEGRVRAVPLDHLSRAVLEEKILAPLGRPLGPRIALVLDCVLGLASAARSGAAPGGDSLWALMCGTEALEYGRAPAEEFYEGILLRARRQGMIGGTIPVRACETIAGANSVFVPRPYQRNIQTGTFRIWKDLVRDAPARWLNFWSIDDRGTALVRAPWAFEGYPSWVWRNLLGCPARKPERMKEFLSALEIDRETLGLLSSDPDWADSAALALGARILQDQGRLEEPAPGFASRRPGRGVEGWIMGVPDAVDP